MNPPEPIDAQNSQGFVNNPTGPVSQHFGDKVYRTIVPRNVRLAEAPSHGVPALVLDKASKGAQAYLALAGEMLRRHEETTAAPAHAPVTAL